MELNSYQQKALSTCMETSFNYIYMAEGLVGEVGEFMSKVAKGVRKGYIKIIDGNLYVQEEHRQEIFEGLKAELGDCLWFVACLAKVLGYEFESIGQSNLDKLQARKQNGTIDGSGDGVTKEERK